MRLVYDHGPDFWKKRQICVRRETMELVQYFIFLFPARRDVLRDALKLSSHPVYLVFCDL